MIVVQENVCQMGDSFRWWRQQRQTYSIQQWPMLLLHVCLCALVQSQSQRFWHYASTILCCSASFLWWEWSTTTQQVCLHVLFCTAVFQQPFVVLFFQCFDIVCHRHWNRGAGPTKLLGEQLLCPAPPIFSVKVTLETVRLLLTQKCLKIPQLLGLYPIVHCV